MSKQTAKKRSMKKFQKANGFLYALCLILVRIILKLFLNTEYDYSGFEEIKRNGGPALVVSPHVSNLDFLFAAAALAPNQVTFVGSHHFMVNPKTRRLLSKAHVIPKKMFCADVSTIISIIRAKEAGQIIVIYPEGRLTCAGHSLYVTEGTAELVKKLGIPVYCIKQDGAYKSLPKWSKFKIRKGKVHVHGFKVFSAERIKELTAAEINDGLEKAILHDEEKVLTDVRYRCDETAVGLNGILYKCPKCRSLFEMKAEGNRIFCGECGAEWTLDEKYVLHGDIFNSINAWYDWQEDEIDLDKYIDSVVTVGTPDENGDLDKNAGKGHLKVNREEICFKGEVNGRPLEFTESTSVITAFPASVNDHISLYSNRILYYFYPEPDRIVTVSWVQYLDKLTKERKKQALIGI